jgi:hypothetical protein
MSEIYRGVTLNDQGDPPPWGIVENSAFKMTIDYSLSDKSSIVSLPDRDLSSMITQNFKKTIDPPSAPGQYTPYILVNSTAFGIVCQGNIMAVAQSEYAYFIRYSAAIGGCETIGMQIEDALDSNQFNVQAYPTDNYDGVIITPSDQSNVDIFNDCTNYGGFISEYAYFTATNDTDSNLLQSYMGAATFTTNSVFLIYDDPGDNYPIIYMGEIGVWISPAIYFDNSQNLVIANGGTATWIFGVSVSYFSPILSFS